MACMPPNHPEVQVISGASVIPVHLKLPPPQLHPLNHRLLEGPVSNQSLGNYYCSSPLWPGPQLKKPGATFPFMKLTPLLTPERPALLWRMMFFCFSGSSEWRERSSKENRANDIWQRFLKPSVAAAFEPVSGKSSKSMNKQSWLAFVVVLLERSDRSYSFQFVLWALFLTITGALVLQVGSLA